jgi:hypothetical protein
MKNVGIFCGHLVHISPPHFGMFYQEKSGNPVLVSIAVTL